MTRLKKSRFALGMLVVLTAMSSLAGAYHQHLAFDGPAVASRDAASSEAQSSGPCLACRAAREQAPALEAPDRPEPIREATPLAARPSIRPAESRPDSSASPRAPPAASEAVSL